jgi:UDP-N-acetylmuramoyl-tripeptide--D-alanyl-D-alanine ligase
MDISALYKCFTECGKVTTDSRNCPEGSMFIALKGETFNGNAYALQALEKGCQYAVVDEKEYAADGHPRILLVDDCLKALQELANYHRHKMGTRIIIGCHIQDSHYLRMGEIHQFPININIFDGFGFHCLRLVI